MPPGSSLDPLVSPWTLVCNPEPYSVILGHYGSYLIHLEWVIEAFHYCALQCTVVHYSAILRFLRFLCFLCYFFTFFAWFGFILSYWSPTNTKITFSLLKQTSEFWHLLFRFTRHLLIYMHIVHRLDLFELLFDFKRIQAVFMFHSPDSSTQICICQNFGLLERNKWTCPLFLAFILFPCFTSGQ